MASKPGFHVGGDILLNGGPKAARPSRFSLVDKVGLASSVVLLVAGALLLANGTCSSPHGLSAGYPVCVGGQLSVQTWLAIIGVEFSLAGSVLMPRLLAAAISRSMASLLAEKGAPLTKVLNSMSSAPFLTQVRQGWRKFALARLAVTVLVLGITVAYKFSFVLVDRADAVLVEADWTEMSSSTSVPGELCRTGDSWAGDDSVFNNNYRDLVAGSNNSILYVGSWAANATSGPATLYMGPSVNVTSVPQLRNGTVTRCVPATFTKFDISAAPASHSWAEASAPFVHGSTFGESPGPDRNGYITVVGRPDGSLMIMPFNNGTFEPGSDPVYGRDYEFVVTVGVQDCWGNFTWSNALGYQVFSMQEPVDTFCTRRDMSSYTTDYSPYYTFSASTLYARAIIMAYFAGRSNYNAGVRSVRWDAKRAVELFLLSLPIEKRPPLPEPGSLALSNPSLRAACDANALPPYDPDRSCPWAPSSLALLSGVIDSHGTGMTALGLALQGVVAALALVATVVFLLPGLAFLSEWPAQWLALAGDLPQREVAAAVSETSMGKGFVGDHLGGVVLVSVLDEQRVVARLQKGAD